MARIVIPRLQIIYREVFRLQPFYRFMKKTLQENEFTDLKNDPDMTNMELLYFQRNGTTVRANERELWWWWRTVKHSTGANKYVVPHLDVNFNGLQITDVEVLINGKKEKVQHGEFRLFIQPWLEVSEFDKHIVLKYIDNFFRTRIMKRNLEEQRKMLYQDAYNFQNLVKDYLEMKSFLPQEEKFHEKMEFI